VPVSDAKSELPVNHKIIK